MAASPPPSRPSSPADDLVRQGTALASQGRLSDAARLYGQAAGVHRRHHRPEDEARCLTLAAQSLRLDGDLHGARVLIGRARLIVRSGGPAAIAAATEKAEVDAAHGDLEGAALALDEAIRWREPDASADLLRRRALVEIGLGRAADADRDLAEAASRLEAAGDEPGARRVLVERATALHNLRAGPEAVAALAEARGRADAAGDHARLGELDLLEAAIAVDERRIEDADALTRRARQHALDGMEPVLYVGASVALSELAEARGDPVAAYEALAVGWATLGDLLGRDGATTVFRPRMQALEARLGPASFAEARAAYEARRRARLGQGPAAG
jgi:tetratricopeptide (TPR) repeat protein